ncbi:MFS transporter [Rubrobacter indicoceani]|uniref:MFS transporter n=1 Tax=Rubrobacter indicoceani TaxID=2051957 RepID=UPI000E5B0416|nr:MFS transporter [Rubrobacter indicoceani]
MQRLLVLACSIVLVDTLFHSALVPLIPYFTEEFGLSKLGVGVLSGAFGAGVLVGSVPGGYLVSRAGVKVSAISGFGIFSVTSIVFAFAESGWLLMLARFGEGFGSALSWIAAFTWVITNTEDGRRGQAIGTLMSSAVVGALLGPVVGSVAATVGLVPTFLTVAALGLALAAWIYATPAPAPNPDRPFFPMLMKLFDRRLVTGMWLVTLSPLLFGAPVVLAPLALDSLSWGAVAIGAVFLVAAGLEAVAQPLLGRWTDGAGFKRPLVVGLSGSLLLLLAFPFTGSYGFAVAALVVLAAVFFNGSVTPGTALFSRASEDAGLDQAIVFSAVNLAWATGSAFGAPLAGAVSDLGGPAYGDALAYLLLAAVCAAALLNIARREKLA